MIHNKEPDKTHRVLSGYKNKFMSFKFHMEVSQINNLVYHSCSNARDYSCLSCEFGRKLCHTADQSKSDHLQ